MAFVSGGAKGMSLDGRRKLSWSDVLAIGAGERDAVRYGSQERTAEALAKPWVLPNRT